MVDLLVSRDEAKAKLISQIEKAEEILSNRSILEVNEMSAKWYSYTLLLLEKIFVDQKFKSEFNAARRPPRIVRGGLSAADKFVSLQDTVGRRKSKLESFIERLSLLDEPTEQLLTETASTISTDNKSVFIVHGHHGEAKQEVARFLERLGLNAVILHEKANGSKTIIEKIEAHTNVGYGVVLYTDCDVGSTKTEPEKLKARARQNVVFEHGFLMGKLGRNKVAALVRGDIEIPNDISGIVYIGMNDDSWKNDLVKELRDADIEVDLTKLF